MPAGADSIHSPLPFPFFFWLLAFQQQKSAVLTVMAPDARTSAGLVTATGTAAQKGVVLVAGATGRLVGFVGMGPAGHWAYVV